VSRRWIAALLSLASVQGLAQPAVSPEELGVEAADIIGRLDLDVPDSPAFAILGITPQNVINPDTPAELATAIFAGEDAKGNSQEGLAIEFRPYLMAMGSDITVGDYYRNQWLSRLAVSLAQSQGTSDADRTDRNAIGFTLTPIDDRDPLTSTYVDTCLGNASQQANHIDTGRRLREELREAILARDAAEESGDPDVLASAEVRVAAAEAAVDTWVSGDRKVMIEDLADQCLSTHKTETINARQLQIGFGYHDSEVEDLDESGSSLWISYALPLGHGSLTAHARMSTDLLESDPNATGSYQVLDKSMLALRYRVGDERRAVLFEAAYVDESDAAGTLDDAYSTALIGVEFRLQESLWIQFALGETFGSNRDSNLALSGQFRWAASKTRLWQ
jgi:hypothetical protein